MSDAVDISKFSEHVTLQDCKDLLHYGHFIPVSRGFTARYVDSVFPDWTWNELVLVFVAAGIFINRGGSAPTCDERVVSFHFSSPTQFHVEWVDDVEPRDVRKRRLANDRSTGQYEFAGGVFSVGGAEPPTRDIEQPRSRPRRTP